MTQTVRWIRSGAIALTMVFTIGLPAFAQITTGAVSGTVKDVQGGVVPGATVTLTSEAKGTTQTPTVTNEKGDFQFPVTPVDTYTVEITMPSFKTVKQTGIAVSPGSRIALGTLTLEVGGATETVVVEADTPVIQSQSSERSFTVPTASVENLPFANRGFTTLAALAPGVTGTTAQGTQSCMSTNIVMDGVSTMDTGSSGSALFNINTESIAEVKILESGYQAEYGLRSGLQVLAVTKSGTNRFRGSLYNVRRNSDWNANSKANNSNGVAKPISKSQDIGFSVGGPLGKPGGKNKLFFFFAEEFNPATGGGVQQTFRLPTALERQGDFSQTLDNNGNPYPYIKDPQSTGLCTATAAGDHSGCFADGGVLGRIPQDRLYPLGLNILKMYPLPNNQSTTIGTNHQFIQPTYDTLLYQPALRLDYQMTPGLRVSVKYQGNNMSKRVTLGSLPGWNDAIVPIPRKGTEAVTVNYNINGTTFLEGTYGRAGNQLAGCNGFPVNDVSDSRTTGLANFPLLFPNANIINPDYYAFSILQAQQPPYWDGTQVYKVPAFTWGNRIVSAASTAAGAAPPSVSYPGFVNINTTQDVSINLTHVRGNHTFKTGYYNNHSLKRENNVLGGTNFGTVNFTQDTVGVNPFDTSFGFSNAAIGSFSSFVQASNYAEGTFLYDNREAYVQDSWKVKSNWTLDIGVRFVHAVPQHDDLLQSGNFLPDEWVQSQSPVLYVPGCVNNTATCAGSNRSAKNPLTGQLLGANTAPAIGTLVPNSGQVRNGLFQSGQGIANTTYLFPKLNVGPRFGTAYDLTGTQHYVLRGAIGTYFDRPRGGNAQALVGNTFVSSLQTLRYSQLQSLGGLLTSSPAQLTAYQYHSDLPTTTEWSGGLQMLIPWATSVDVAYVGHRNYNAELTGQINAVDIGSAFDPTKQDPTAAVSATAGAAALAALYPDLLRGYRGYTGIAFRTYDGWRNYHALQFSINRRLRNGVSFGFNDSITLKDVAKIAPRYDHDAAGNLVLRSDQGTLQDLLQNQLAPRHLMKATALWQLPRLKSTGGAGRAVGLIVNDWQLSGVWTGVSGTPYAVGYSYQNGGSNVNLTGSPDYAPRIRVVGGAGGGCSDNQYAQFTAASFQGPLVGSTGLESSNDYLTGCFQSAIDLSLQREIRLGGGRAVTLRLDAFNAPNQSIITTRSTSVTLASPSDPVTIVNNQFNADGSVNTARVRPQNAGFGGVTGYQGARTLQAYIRFKF
ncbi:MAG: TonB-dependent receptor [Acidobacteriota bacterium]